MRPKIIILSGDRGTGNNGDRAITFNAVDRLRKLIDEPDIVFSAPHYTDLFAIYRARFVPGLDKALYGNVDKRWRPGRSLPRSVCRLLRLVTVLASCFAMRWLHLRRPLNTSAAPFLRELHGAQLLLVAGGGQFASLWPVSLLVTATTVLCARILGVPAVATGLGAGPFNSLRHRLLVRSALNQCEFVAARSRTAFKMLRETGVSGRKLTLGVDDAVTLEPAHVEEILTNPAETLKTLPERFIAVQFRLATSSGAGQEEIHKFADALDKIVETLGLTIVFVPFAASDYADDRVSHYRIFARMRNKSSVHLIHSRYDPRALKAVVGSASLALGLGLHFCTFALSSGVPTVGVYRTTYYRAKLGGLFESFAVPECAVPSDRVSSDQLAERLVQCYRNRDHIASVLRANYARQAERWGELYNRVASVATSETTALTEGAVADAGQPVQTIQRRPFGLHRIRRF